MGEGAEERHFRHPRLRAHNWLWDESKTTIFRVTARQSGGMGGGRAEGGTEAGVRGTHSFTPVAFLPRTFWSFLASWTLPQRASKS